MTHVQTPSPGTAQTSTKAIIGAIAAGVVAGLGSFVTAISDGVVDPGEWATIVIALIVGAGLTGGGVYALPNKAK